MSTDWISQLFSRNPGDPASGGLLANNTPSSDGSTSTDAKAYDYFGTPKAISKAFADQGGASDVASSGLLDRVPNLGNRGESSAGVPSLAPGFAALMSDLTPDERKQLLAALLKGP